MEKKKYEELELEVVRFDAEDVVTTSGDGPIPLPCPPNGIPICDGHHQLL